LFIVSSIPFSRGSSSSQAASGRAPTAISASLSTVIVNRNTCAPSEATKAQAAGSVLLGRKGHDITFVRLGVQGQPTCQQWRAGNQRNVRIRKWKCGVRPQPLKVELGPRETSLPNGRERTTRENMANVADTGKAGSRRCCQQNVPAELGQKVLASPVVWPWEPMSEMVPSASAWSRFRSSSTPPRAAKPSASTKLHRYVTGASNRSRTPKPKKSRSRATSWSMASSTKRTANVLVEKREGYPTLELKAHHPHDDMPKSRWRQGLEYPHEYPHP
jgi:hypothetical protein